MQEYQSADLRNIAVIGHGRTGKTSLLDAALFNAGGARRFGKVDDGTSALDYEPEESKRKLSISSALAAVEWRGCKMNFIDTPGYPDFVGEMISALNAADSALIVVSAPSGMETGTEKSWLAVEDLGLPRAIFVNKMDREHADFDRAVDELRARFGSGIVPVQLPIGKEDTFQGVADLLTLHMKIVTHEDEELVADIPEFMQEAVEEALMAFPGTFLVVSHDRYFLDKVANVTMELEHGKLTRYDGNYLYYKESLYLILNNIQITFIIRKRNRRKRP